MLAASIMLFLVYKQTYKNQEWNRRRTSEETLSRLVSGEFYSLLNKLTKEYNWNPANPQNNYSTVVELLNSNKEEIKTLDITVRSIFRILETICININHNIIDEDICHDYLFSILINTYFNNEKFIIKERKIRNNPHVFEHVEYFAKKWQQNNATSTISDTTYRRKKITENSKDKL